MNLTNEYAQLHDYLSQVKGFSGKEGFQKITYVMMAQNCGVSGSTISAFLRSKTQKPIKIFKEFKERYAEEYARWPADERTIGRRLNQRDARRFLHLPLPEDERAPERAPIRDDARAGAATAPAPLSDAPIVISYRGHQTIYDGWGMVYDHITLQTLTNNPTAVSATTRVRERRFAQYFFQEALNTHNVPLPFNQLTIPSTINERDGGLFLVPGRVRKIANEPIREAHEKRFIREALNRGQPILGICAGAWRVWEQALLWTRQWDEVAKRPIRPDVSTCLKEVKDHSYSRMLTLQSSGTRATYNVQVHNIEVSEDTYLEHAMKGKEALLPEQIPVNSVHWNAVNPSNAPLLFRINAVSKQDPEIERKNRHGNMMEPEENSVEGFESEYGAPVVGVQWHPEGYSMDNPKNPRPELHINLLKYMALAGAAYKAKRTMLQELMNRGHAGS